MNVSNYIPPPTLTISELPNIITETNKKIKKPVKEKTIKPTKRSKIATETVFL